MDMTGNMLDYTAHMYSSKDQTSVKIPAASGGALEGRSLLCWGNLSPKPPNKDAIPPNRKQWGILASFRDGRIQSLGRFHIGGVAYFVWALPPNAGGTAQRHGERNPFVSTENLSLPYTYCMSRSIFFGGKQLRLL